MFPRSLFLPDNHSFFLFGPRGVGKTTLIKNFLNQNNVFQLDLLDFELETRLLTNPKEFQEILEGLPKTIKWIFIDEIQKIPKLLDEIHRHIENNPSHYFALTGSSARKLKRGQANLLAGRAFSYYLFPFTMAELDKTFNLNETLTFGTLPSLFTLTSTEDKKQYLRTYCQTYLQEEILQEGIIRNLSAFRQFLPLAASQNGQIISWSNIAQDISVDAKTIRTYFEILEDTLIGFLVPAYHRSIRKRQKTHPKFYLFDSGVKRALANELNIPLVPQTSDYGRAFEHWIITEIFRLNHYKTLDYQLSYFATHNIEIDLVIERPGQKTILLEIKSIDHIRTKELNSLAFLAEDFPNNRAICVSRDPIRRIIKNILVCPYTEILEEILK